MVPPSDHLAMAAQVAAGSSGLYGRSASNPHVGRIENYPSLRRECMCCARSPPTGGGQTSIGRTSLFLQRLGCVAATLLLTVTPTWAKSTPRPTTSASELRTWVKEQQAKLGYVGVAAALVVDDKVAWRQGFGYADKEAGVLMAPTTQVGIGSVTKTFTALATMELREHAVIDIDKPLAVYLPQFHIKTHGEDLNQVTLRAMITHTSGLPTDVWKNSDLAHGRYTDVVGLLNETAMAAPPHVVGIYSNAAYNLLGNVIALVSGTDYPAYVEGHIFEPLGMKNSSFAFDQNQRVRTKFYNPDGTLVTPPELRDVASGGIYSSVDDLVLYARALMRAYNGKASPVIGRETIRTMWTLQNGDIPIETNKEGLGWFLFKNGEKFAAFHSGSTGYSNATLLLLPQHNAAAVMLANTAGSISLCNDFAFRFLETYGLRVKDISPPPANAPTAEPGTQGAGTDLSVHAGYYARQHDYIKVSVDGNGLLIRENGKTIRAEADGPDFLERIGETHYYFKDLGPYPYHVLFSRQGDREQQLGYRVEPPKADSTWSRRLGRYQLFGYNLMGFERVVDAEVSLQGDGLPILTVTFNTGKYTYPLVDLGPNEARTGGLGPSDTGYMVYFSRDSDSGVLTYLGLTFRKSN
jgi:CubicO group peptidase (beta-lactamase class C family)